MAAASFVSQWTPGVTPRIADQGRLPLHRYAARHADHSATAGRPVPPSIQYLISSFMILGNE